MNYKDFKQKVLNHLIKYKKEKLKINDSGKWKNIEIEHILPDSKRFKNYLCKEIKSLNLKPHQYWYHLNSSQTMCINFFEPIKNNCGAIKHLFGIDIGEINIFEYEHIESLTNFDLYIEGNKKLYFEIKYTEDGISKKSSSSNKAKTFNNVYKPLINKNNLFKNINEDMFMNNHYQAYRNMVMANKDSYTIFITMKENENTYNELVSSLNDLGLDINGNNNIKIIFLEDLIDKTINYFKDNDDLLNYYKEFKYKYLDYRYD